MAARKGIAKAADPAAQTPLHVEMRSGDTPRQAVARKIAGPFTRHAFVAAEAVERITGSLPDEQNPSIMEYAWSLKERADNAAGGNPAEASAMLMAQALSLDAIYTELARIALANVTNGDAMERYLRIALKAQAGSRTALEAHARLHQPREQTVRHVHVNEGGQAVIADQFHHHTGGQQNGQSAGQPHAAGTGAAGASPSLPSPDPLRQAVPVASGEGQPAMPNARGQGKRRA